MMKILENILVALVYFLAAKLCQTLAIEPGNVTPIWASSGICFIWVLKRGYYNLPGVFLGAFIGNVWAYLFKDTSLFNPIMAGLFNGIGDLLCIYVAVYSFKKFAKTEDIFNNLRSIVTFIFMCSIFSSGISAVFGVMGLSLFGIIPWNSFTDVFFTWLIGDTMGFMFMAPFLQLIYDQSYKEIKWDKVKTLEIIGLSSFAAYLVYLFIIYTKSNPTVSFVAFYLLPTLAAIIALKYEKFITLCFSILVSASVIIVTIIFEVDLPRYTLNESLILRQMCMFSALSTTFFILATMNHIKNLTLKFSHTEKLAALGELSSGIAHEINNPLSIIAGNASLIPKNLENQEKLENIREKISRSSNRIKVIVDGLRKFSRTDSPEKEHVLVQNLVKECEVLVKPKLNQNNVEFRNRTGETSLSVFCNEIQIEQVLINLIGNACDAVKTLENPWVEISVKEKKRFIEIIVRDNGSGIDSNIVNKLFNPFFTTKRVGEGTGLGLSISHSIAEDHGGDLEYKLIDGHTSFVLSLPKII